MGRQREDGRWTWHWDPAFVHGRFGTDLNVARTTQVAPRSCMGLTPPMDS